SGSSIKAGVHNFGAVCGMISAVHIFAGHSDNQCRTVHRFCYLSAIFPMQICSRSTDGNYFTPSRAEPTHQIAPKKSVGTANDHATLIFKIEHVQILASFREIDNGLTEFCKLFEAQKSPRGNI